ncbi:HK97 gp10 family phage protein [Virgibacillus natechei]|uniref:HK97 gp10 family phage protein n=1 Tax=Virgibacillus natechei TaxID=1216297 RepID=A0ABS4IAQ7_9BACI|nr:HK97-gp10 family putative phage morphogenesis protein [Virgibacillus natechei]MBP1967978.1 HK97 gp10 family phage protein [Virgibacillus natechei]UZD14736.1 HK97 gp10 family phage protein [Virgibacillus natechei]
MSRMKMEIEGFDELVQHFEKMGNGAKRLEAEALKEGGEVIAEHQRKGVNRSAKNQPHIEDNIEVGRVTNTQEGSKVIIRPNKKVRWRAKFLEYGTSKMPPKPFIERSGELGQAEAYELMQAKFEEVIND